ncbi:hypothetical protein GCM10017786_53560 [Amycolatopsis deserti]|uniref:GyrI-like small molecule binding domain-containing protein n=1 Tax=Amycolatopsis deserti TaxID=185696 RepID=A0ABQ3JCW5_9PSEU|nr:GyrI-like domain-containing protein [Amycolatopsis deserti]GHF12848.1 hypothetical protein GCM10017786_53560 [Amycolatopsis deserti]
MSHIGSCDDEGPVLARLPGYLGAHGLRHSGLHHEIYLGDRRAPDKLRTVLRQPIEPLA